MLTYKNKVTGAIISVDCECSGDNWELVASKDQKKDQKKGPEKDPEKDPEAGKGQ